MRAWFPYIEDRITQGIPELMLGRYVKVETVALELVSDGLYRVTLFITCLRGAPAPMPFIYVTDAPPAKMQADIDRACDMLIPLFRKPLDGNRPIVV